MNKKIYILAILVIVLSACGTYIITSDNSNKRDSSSYSNNKGKNGPTTKEGVFSCLEVKDPSQPHTLECANGLKMDDGNAYALTIEDPRLINVPTGQRIEVTGELALHESEKYKMIGTITVTDIKKVQP